MMIMATAAGTWTQQHAGFVDYCSDGRVQARRHREQLAGACDIGRAVAIGKQSVVADAVEAVRQDVDEKRRDELVRAERHDFVSRAAIGAITLYLKVTPLWLEAISRRLEMATRWV